MRFGLVTKDDLEQLKAELLTEMQNAQDNDHRRLDQALATLRQSLNDQIARPLVDELRHQLSPLAKEVFQEHIAPLLSDELMANTDWDDLYDRISASLAEKLNAEIDRQDLADRTARILVEEDYFDPEEVQGLVADAVNERLELSLRPRD